MHLRALVFCLFFTGTCLAQTVQTSKLLELSRRLEEQEQSARQRISSARLLTPTLKLDSNGTSFLLVDINPDGSPVYRMTFNAGAAQSTGVDIVQTPALSGLNLQGEGIAFSVWDAGMVKDHVEFGSRLTAVQSEELSSHATHVTGTLIASGVNPLAKGMAPLATANTFFFAADFPAMAARAAKDESLIISNHSYGTATGWFRDGGGWTWSGNDLISSLEDYRFGLYGPRAAALDELTFLAPYYSIFWAAGNDRSDTGAGGHPADCNLGTGYDCIIPDAVAKNIFTIGAVNKVSSYVSPSSVVMGTYGSWGPTDDGRIKPDLVAVGTDLFSTSASGTNSYEVMGGTSMATPNAAGSLGLLQELYKRNNSGQVMRSATLKALAIHTAKEAGSFPGPDYSFGWGLVDAAGGASHLMKVDGIANRVEELTLNDGEKIEIPLLPVAGKKITATIAWTDPAASVTPPGLDVPTIVLVNDLDLRIVDAQGTEQKPWTLDPLNPSRQASRGDNFRDNVEKLEFNSPEQKSYKLVVSHKGRLKNGSQDFSLILSYQTVGGGTTYYWINGAGSWTQSSHWSLSTGGVSANIVPGSNDHVIFDENSFSTDGSVVGISTDVAVKNFNWINSKAIELNLGNHELTIGNQMSLSSDNISIRSGTIRFSNGVNGNVYWSSSIHQNINLHISGGQWSWHGKTDVNSFTIDGQVEVTIIDQSVRTSNMAINATGKLNLNGTSLIIGNRFDLNGTDLQLSSTNSELSDFGPLTLNWNSASWAGIVKANSVVLLGNNILNKLQVDGICDVRGSNSISNLILNPGGTMSLSDGTTQSIGDMSLRGIPSMKTSLMSAGSASLQTSRHNLYCFPWLTVRNVAVKGLAVVAAPSSDIVGTGWLQVDCDKVLYADFKINPGCANGVVKINLTANGQAGTFEWTLTNPDGVQTIQRLTSNESPYFSYGRAGTYSLKLKMTSNATADEVTKTIVVSENPMPANSVVASNTNLTSLVTGTSYEWFRNGRIITNEISRSVEIGGQPGVYSVAAYSGDCNSVSTPFVFTGIEQLKEPLLVWPNPASGSIRLNIGSSQLAAINSIGQYFNLTRSTDESWDISSLRDGIYLLMADGAVISRIVVNNHK